MSRSAARDRAELVTDDKAGLKEQLEALSGERIAALEALGEDRGRASETSAGKDLGSARDGPQPPMGLAKESAKTPEPKSADRDLRL